MNETLQGHTRAHLPMAELPLPAGWFAVVLGRDLPRGRVIPARLGEHDLVAWRDERGTACVADAWCPHLGAHLGHVGRVAGESLVCGFHGFRFGSDGNCLATGYGGRVPPRARLSTWPSAEVDGVILAYHDPDGQPPSWTVPPVDTAGWTSVRWRTFRFTGHPLEIVENSVDMGHLSFVHGYTAVRELSRARAEGPVLTSTYGIRRTSRIFGVPAPAMGGTFRATAHGLGFSRVDVTVHTLGAQVRLWVLPTPLGNGTVLLRIGVSVRKGAGPETPAALRWLPAWLTAAPVRDFAGLALANDVSQDRRIWQVKHHLSRPAIAEGDGPIGTYRRWAGQFLPGATVPAPAGHPVPQGAASAVRS